MGATKDKKGGGLLKENIDIVLAFLSPDIEKLVITIILLMITICTEIFKKSIGILDLIVSLFTWAISLYLCTCTILYIKHRFVWSSTPATKEASNERRKSSK